MLEAECYQILRISERASFEEIKKAYRRSVQLYHPDVRRWDKNSGERFKRIASAYRILSDKKRQTEVEKEKRSGAFFSRFRFVPKPAVKAPAPQPPAEAGESSRAREMPTAELAVRFLGTENVFVKREVVKIMRYKKDKTALRILAKGLKDADSEVRRLAVQSMAYFKEPQVVYLIASLLTDPDIKVRYEAIASLGIHRGDRAVSILKRLTKGKSFFIREKAVAALNYSVRKFFQEGAG